jgi:peptidyl-prolyl cis-trans isomerase A (cyclophilin A)
MNHRWIIAGSLLLISVAACNRAEQASTDNAASSTGDATTTVGGALRNEAEPTVVFSTTLGTIKVRLNPAKAPLTVDNFLAQVDSGFYNETIFHEIEPGYVVLAGGFRADLSERKSRYSIRNEANNGLPNRRGSVAMARPADGLDSGTGQFFINIADNPALDYQAETPEQCGYCVFGEVIEGMDVVDRIAQLPTRSVGELSHVPAETVMIETARKVR